jgi:beta-galactosidase
VSAAAFRAWLQRRYGTIAALNEAWGTAFWSQRYDAWDEINPPRAAPTFANPTQQLDYVVMQQAPPHQAKHTAS